MIDHPFLSLVVEALNLTHPRFALANGREYSPEEAAEPPAARKVRERSFLMEFYHEFRRLWDRAVPVQRGLGHIVIQADPEAGCAPPTCSSGNWANTARPTSASRPSRSPFARTPTPSPPTRRSSRAGTRRRAIRLR